MLGGLPSGFAYYACVSVYMYTLVHLCVCVQSRCRKANPRDPIRGHEFEGQGSEFLPNGKQGIVSRHVLQAEAVKCEFLQR